MEWLTLLGFLVLLAVGTARGRAPGTSRRPLPKRVLLAGDSHAQGLAPTLGDAFRARNVPLDISFAVGSTARDWRRERLAQALERSPAPLVLLVLGTNDCVSPALEAEFSTNLRTLLEAGKRSERTIVLLQPPGACARIRAALEAAGADVFVPPELPMNGVHATPEGYRRWSSSIVEHFV